MAVDVYSENIIGFISPRLSFSNDIENDTTTDNNQIDDTFSYRLHHSLPDSTFDFAFNVDATTSFHSSTADELFSNGKIIPISLKKEVKQDLTPILKSCLDESSQKSTPEEKKKSLKEFLEDNIDDDDDEPNTTAKSFWKFRRSNSLNCDTNERKGLIGSCKILSRSGSTGKFLEKIVEDDESTSRKSFWKFSRNNSLNSEPTNIVKRSLNGSCKILKRSDSAQNQCINVDYIATLKSFRRSSSLNCETWKEINQGLVGSIDKFLPRSYSSGCAPRKHEQFRPISAKARQKKQVKSSFEGYGCENYSANVKVSSVLNLPSPYISRVSVDLFGFRMFCNGIGKDKKKRK